MKDRFLLNNQSLVVHDSVTGTDLSVVDMYELLNDLYNSNRELEDDNRYYRALYDMYERNFVLFKKRVDVLIGKYRECGVDDDVVVEVVEDLEGLFGGE